MFYIVIQLYAIFFSSFFLFGLELQRAKPIPISQFSEVVKRKHFNANIAFEDEFEVSLKNIQGLYNLLFGDFPVVSN